MSKQTIKTIAIGATCAWLGAVTTLWAGGHDVPPEFDPSILDADLNKELEETVMAMGDRWNSQDYSTVLEMWDKDEEVPFYLAEEQADWFIGWNPLNEYLAPDNPAASPIDVMRLLPSNVRAKRIADDLAIAVWDLHFEMKMKFGKPIGEDVRVSGVFRKKPEGWRFIHYAESPKTPMVVIEGLFQKEVRDDWDEFYKDAKKRREAVLRR